jgi:hypothetical protein
MLRRATETAVGRLVLLLSAVALIVLGSAALAQFALNQHEDFGESLWSATLHLLDPSSLQDDESAGERAVGLFQVITGLVLIVGVLFTVVSEQLGSSLEQLGRSSSPLRARGHLLIVGGLDLIPVAARGIAQAARQDPTLKRLAVLAPEEARDSRDQLRAALRDACGGLRTEIVFGDTAGDSGFELAAAEAARAVLLMPSSSGPLLAEAADVEATQSGLALAPYLKERRADPMVRMLFRRGRNVEASWGLFPDSWDAVVADRTVSAVLRLAITEPEALSSVPGLDSEGAADADWCARVREAWAGADAEGRPLRLTIVGCGINAPALMEDLAQFGAERFAVTMIATRRAFDSYLDGGEGSGVPVDFVEASPNAPERLRQDLGAAEPDLILVSPSPTSADLRLSDAGATLSALHVLRSAGERTPVIAELFLPESADRLPGDPRLFPVSGLHAVAVAIALSIFDAPRAAELKRRLAAGAPDS